jgi:putative hemolysin
MILLELLVVALLILVNGFLAMAEIALVSSRPARLNALAEQGLEGAPQAAALAADPARFLSTVQLGITLVGILSGAFSGATLGVRLSDWLAALGLPGPAAEMLGIGSVVVVITYCALIVGELVPKQIALRNPEAIAVRVAPAMVLLSRLATPLVWLLSASGRVVLKALGQSSETGTGVTDEEIEMLLVEAENAGVIAPDERGMIAGVMRLADREVHLIMSPRDEADWIDLSAEPTVIRKTLIETQHSHLPAANGDPKRMVGLVRTREYLSMVLLDKPVELRGLVRPAPVIRDRANALEALKTLRNSSIPLALVEDEAGRFQGVISPVDILNAIAGVVRVEWEDEPMAVRRDDGSWLLAGSMPVAELSGSLGLALPDEPETRTVAGFIQSLFGRLPKTGESIEAHGWRFEVIDLDGRRIDKVLASSIGNSVAVGTGKGDRPSP